MRVLAVTGSKGGTGKTTTAAYLAAAAAARGISTLAVDLDAQGALTALLRGRALAEGEAGAADVLTGAATLAEVAHPTAAGPDLAGGGMALARVELALATEVGRELVLREAIEAAGDRWCLAVLDCPPNLGLLTVAALVAADAALVPVLPSFLSLAAVRSFAETCATVRKRLNRHLAPPWYVLAMVDGRERAPAEVRAVLGAAAGADLLPVAVRVDAALKAAPAEGRLPRGRGAEDLEALAALVLERLDL